MTGFILRRTLSMLVTFIVVSIVIFLMMHSITGGPFDGNDMPLPDNIRARLMAQLGLDQPLYEQYLRYMWGVLPFRFRRALSKPRRDRDGADCPCLGAEPDAGRARHSDRRADRHPARHGCGAQRAIRWIDYFASAIATLGLTVPVFVISTLLILVFAVWLGLAPGQRLGRAEALDPADPRLRSGAARDLRALCPLGHARYAQQAIRHGAPRQGPVASVKSSSSMCCAIPRSRW